MKIIITPDSFKGSLTALEAAEAMAAGVRRAMPEAEIVSIPLADGGEGTVDAWLRACGGHLETRMVTGPLGDPIAASFGVLADGRTAVVETAAASGLTLVPASLRNPLNTTTYGTGELIHHAKDSGVKRLIVGLGGSATNDGGAGALQALGTVFRDASGEVIPTPITGGRVEEIRSIDGSGLPKSTGLSVVIASDVDNPLTGPNGASMIFGRQKGATLEMVARLDAALARYGDLLAEWFGVDVVAAPGSGAAGGLGAAMMALFKAPARSGIDLLLDAAGFDAVVAEADLVLTGEGSIDRQTLSGKAVMGVVRRCRSAGRAKVIAIGGIVDAGAAEALKAAGVVYIAPASPASMAVDEAMARAAELVEEAAFKACRRAAG